MKIIASALALLTLLSVSILAQSSSTTEPVLQINCFRWAERISQFWCEGCSELPPATQDYRWRHRPGAGDFAVWVVLKT